MPCSAVSFFFNCTHTMYLPYKVYDIDDIGMMVSGEMKRALTRFNVYSELTRYRIVIFPSN